MNIYVGNLSYDATEDQLREMFGECGQVESASIVMDRVTGRSRGFGFVVMPNDTEAEQAITQLNDKDMGGRSLKVNQAKQRTDDRNTRRGSGR